MITHETRISLLYTAALNGDLALLPRLFTCIRQERAAIVERAPESITVLVDLGQSCTPEAWVCAATGGRGMLVAMDAMGYDAFHIGPRDMLYAQPALVEQLRQIVSTPFAAGPWLAGVSRGGYKVTCVNAVNLHKYSPTDLGTPDLVVALRFSETPTLDASWRDPLRVVVLDGGHPNEGVIFGRIDCILTPTPPYVLIDRHTHLAIPINMVPDPTITGVIEFVQSEAQYAERRRGQA